MSFAYAPDGRLRAGWRFFLGVIVAVVANGIAIEIALAIAGRSDRLLDAIYRPLAMLLLLAGFSFLLLTADEISGRPITDMGLDLDRYWLRDLLLGLLIGGGMIALAVGGMTAAHTSFQFSSRLTGHAAALAAVELLILSTGAMTEELMFRGYPFQRLIEAVGPARAVILLSLLFGAVHLDNPHSSRWAFINTIAVGVLFSVAYLKTRGLWLPWALHFGWNAALGMGFGLPVSGLTDFSVLVRAKVAGPLWATGGDYGVEASAVGTAVIALGLVVVSLLPTRTEAEQRLGMQRSLRDPGNNSSPTGIQI